MIILYIVYMINKYKLNSEVVRAKFPTNKLFKRLSSVWLKNLVCVYVCYRVYIQVLL